MPLPVNTTLSLQGHTRPGESIASKSKRAMIVRLSEATLDALQQLAVGERMEFEFGAKTGIHIQESFFPMKLDAITNHELFIRTIAPKRPSGHLKLNANVVGRLSVDTTSHDRDLSRVRRQLLESRSAADKEKSERKIVVLDAPPPVVKPSASRPAPKGQKKKQTAKATAAREAPSRGLSPYPNTSAVQSTVQPVPAQQPQASTSTAAIAVEAISSAPVIDDLSSLRGRLVHFLALGSQSTKDLAAELRGDMSNETFTEQLVNALNELAEKNPLPKNANGASTTWRLKLSSWLAIRPHTYPHYTESQRLTSERNARGVLSRLGIKEGDPQWEHVKFRGGSGASSAAPTGKKTSKGKAAATEIKAKSEAVIPPSFKGKASADASTNLRPPASTAPKASQSNPLSSTVSTRNQPPPSTVPTPSEREQRERERLKRELDPEWEEGQISASTTPPREPPTRSTTAPVNRRLPGSKPGSATPNPSGIAANGAARNGVGTTTTVAKASRDRESYAQSDRESERERPLAMTVRRDPPAAKKGERPSSALSNSVLKQEKASSALPNVKTEKSDKDRDRTVASLNHAESDRERDREREREKEREREARLRESAVREREKYRAREQEARSQKGTKRKAPTWTDDDSDEDDQASVSTVSRKPARGEASHLELTKKVRASEAVAPTGSGSGRNASTAGVANGKYREESDRERVRDREHAKRDRRDWTPERGRERDGGRERERNRDRDKPRDKERERDRVERDQEMHERERRHRAGSPPPRKVIKREEPPSPVPHKRVGSTTGVSRMNGAHSSTKANERQSSAAVKREPQSGTKEGGTSRVVEKERERRRDPQPRKERLGSEARRQRAEYTSSEDEDAPPPAKSVKKANGASAGARRPRAPAPPSSASTPSSSTPSSAPSPLNLPSDNASLRSLYSITYAKFMKVFQELVIQKEKVRSLLGRGGKVPNGVPNGRLANRSPTSDDEDMIDVSDADVPDTEELERLVNEHNRLREELDNIRSAFVG